MRESKHRFYSDGIELDASIYRPDEDGDPSAPVVLPCSGFTGTNSIHPARFARGLTRRGYACVGFDYRGMGESAGTRDVVYCEEQTRDIAHAVAWIKSVEELRDRPLYLLGWGMGGGLVLEAARLVSEQLAGVLAINGFYNGERVQRALRGDDGWLEFRSWLYQRRCEALGSAATLMVDPFDVYPLDPVSRGYVDGVLRKVPGYQSAVNLTFADSLLTFRPEQAVSALEELPLFIAHGSDNALHPTVEAEVLRERYPGPVELHWLEGAGHTEWMHDDNPILGGLLGEIDDWIQVH